MDQTRRCSMSIRPVRLWHLRLSMHSMPSMPSVPQRPLPLTPLPLPAGAWGSGLDAMAPLHPVPSPTVVCPICVLRWRCPVPARKRPLPPPLDLNSPCASPTWSEEYTTSLRASPGALPRSARARAASSATTTASLVVPLNVGKGGQWQNAARGARVG